MAADNQSASECYVASREDSISDRMISLTTSEDSLRANCCAAGNPLPSVSWELCTGNSTTGCTALTNATQSTAELTLTGRDLPAGNSSVRCVAEYLDVREVVRSLRLNTEKQDGKTERYCRLPRKLSLCFRQRYYLLNTHETA